MASVGESESTTMANYILKKLFLKKNQVKRRKAEIVYKEFAEVGEPANVYEKKIVYFDQISGLDLENITRMTCELALERALELGLKWIVLACSTGNTVPIMCKVSEEKCVKIGEDINIISIGGGRKAIWAKDAAKKGMINIAGTPALSGVDRSVRWKYGGIYPMELIAATLKCICQGMKVCVEIALMACDAKELPENEDVVSISGTHAGADTAVVMKGCTSSNFFDEDKGIKIREIICMPCVRPPRGYRRVYGAHGV